MPARRVDLLISIGCADGGNARVRDRSSPWPTSESNAGNCHRSRWDSGEKRDRRLPLNRSCSSRETRATSSQALRIVAGARVVGVVDGEARGPKLRVFKKKRRKGFRKTRGHRSIFTRVRITEIVA